MMCLIHQHKMVEKNVPILYGMPIGPPFGYFEVKEKEFENCDDDIIGGCVIENNSQKYKKKYICEKCN